MHNRHLIIKKISTPYMKIFLITRDPHLCSTNTRKCIFHHVLIGNPYYGLGRGNKDTCCIIRNLFLNGGSILCFPDLDDPSVEIFSYRLDAWLLGFNGSS
jgi:hypothetical protein